MIIGEMICALGMTVLTPNPQGAVACTADQKARMAVHCKKGDKTRSTATVPSRPRKGGLTQQDCKPLLVQGVSGPGVR
ncbi:MAG TPA: hypothetical protein VE954_20970 [Oligoflexus sp.]|uniref:hypothetical protein n=1 Tax=Oligoflexus sp. TaxID=1971216 RepID=UPI002D49EFC5|nr:hypothetical protein [Oligoflexus sp.]HYX35577.1 hypothetical protein [Oligoflexus sp.]